MTDDAPTPAPRADGPSVPARVRAELSISGGLGPFALRPRHVVVDTAQLEPAEAGEVRTLLDAADLAAQPARTSSGKPDVFSYRLAVDGGPAPIEFDDLSMAPEVRRLVDLLQRLAASHPT